MKETARMIFRLERKIVKLSPGRICFGGLKTLSRDDLCSPGANSRDFGQEVLTHNIRQGTSQLGV